MPDGFKPLTAQEIAEKYDEILQTLEFDYVNDYYDELQYNPPYPNTFTLKYIAAENNLRFFVNGVHYIENIHYLLDRTNKSLTWIATANNGGFDLKSNYKIFAVYDYYFKDNP